MIPFRDYVTKLRESRRPLDPGLPKMGTQSPLSNQEQFYQLQPKTVATKQYEIPKIDSENVIGSLRGMLGPSPEERAAEEKRLQDHRQKMHGWTALFNGLRHLGNLYYAAKGAPGQKFSNPHQQIEQQYQDERKRLAEIQEANRNYYAGLYNLRRQSEADQRASESHQMQIDWRNAQLEEQKRQFEERQRQFDERQRQRQQQFEARQRQQQEQFEERQRSKNPTTKGGRSAKNDGGVSETVEWEDDQGRKHKRTVKGGGSRQIKGYRRNGASSSGSGKGNGY